MFEIASYILAPITAMLLNIDRNQTLQIKDHPNLHEVNVILGKHPSDKKVNIYFAITILCALSLPFTMNKVLSPEYTVATLAAVSALQIGVIYNNVKNKLKIKFW